MAAASQQLTIRTLVVGAGRNLGDISHLLPSNFKIVAEYESPVQASEFLKKVTLDLVFAELGLLEVLHPFLQTLQEQRQGPLAIVVAPGTEFAARAFELQAFDYLVEPISEGRLLGLIDRIDRELSFRHAVDAEKAILMFTRRAGRGLIIQDRIVLRSRGRYVLLRCQEIDWIQAEGDYVRVHVGNDSYLERQKMSGIENKLDPSRFVRIHRSAIVNLDKIKELRSLPTGEYAVLMRTGKELTLSRGYRENMNFLLDQNIESQVL